MSAGTDFTLDAEEPGSWTKKDWPLQRAALASDSGDFR